MRGMNFVRLRACRFGDCVGDFLIREFDVEDDRNLMLLDFVDQERDRSGTGFCIGRAAGKSGEVIQPVRVGKVPEWEAVADDDRFPDGAGDEVLVLFIEVG